MAKVIFVPSKSAVVAMDIWRRRWRRHCHDGFAYGLGERAKYAANAAKAARSAQ